MTVQTFNPSDMSQSAANWAVSQRIVGAFAPHAQMAPNLTLALDPGYLLNDTMLVEVGPQSVGPFFPPTSGFRIDRVVVDRSTGAATVVTGIANSLNPPAIPAGKLPVAQIHLQGTTLTITNDIIVDERVIAATFTPSARRVIGFRADLNGVSLPISASVYTLVPMIVSSSQAFNIGNAFNPETHRFQPNVAGFYQVNAQIHYTNMPAGKGCNTYIYKNGMVFGHAATTATGGGETVQYCDVIYLNGTTDYLELYGFYNPGTTTGNNIGGEISASWFSAAYIG